MRRTFVGSLLPVARVSDLEDGPLARTWCGDRIVLFRTGEGVACLKDECPHRQALLSNGFVCRGEIVCAEHGWRFDGRGVRVLTSHGAAIEARQAVQTYRVVVLLGCIFIAGRRRRRDV